ncbi:NmrA-like family protein [Mycena vitilis]|nr:NmrA-like family protein [Mycena vitilis]
MAISVLIFGATGAVGSACARHAHSLGATVTLAVRDTKKPIPGLSLEQEKAAGYKRVQADLTQPETVTEAVAQSGAKHAFVYLIFSPPGESDPNRAALKALKSAGVEFVVFLSSFTVALYEPAIDRVPEHDYVALRPAGFASNTLRWAGMFKAGVVKMPHPETNFDWIVPEDIGRAGATILVGDAAEIIGKVVGKELTVEAISDEEAVKDLAPHLPEYLARHLVGSLVNGFKGSSLSLETFWVSGQYNVAVENVRKYAGKATTLAEWATKNKHAFE